MGLQKKKRGWYREVGETLWVLLRIVCVVWGQVVGLEVSTRGVTMNGV